MLIDGREVSLSTDAVFGRDWDDALSEAVVEYAEWADTELEFTAAEYEQYQDVLNDLAFDAAWEQTR